MGRDSHRCLPCGRSPGVGDEFRNGRGCGDGLMMVLMLVVFQFGVALPTYDRARLLPRALRTVLA